MVREISVSLDRRSYRVVTAPFSAWQRLALPELQGRGTHGLLVTDDNVGPLHAERVRSFFASRGLECRVLSLRPGEATKDISSLLSLVDDCLNYRLRRDGWIVALGGGVIGDLAGLAAALYLRGIAFVQVPTSLLAMADASVGGKVAVNYAGAKNVFGTFHQPSLVLTSPEFLVTLTEEHIANGMAEVIKAGVIGDPALFDLATRESARIWARDPEVLGEVIERSVSVKARIVAQDERDEGLRQVLNLGHTIGHALEAATGFTRPLHGEAVGLGMLAACRLSVALGLAVRSLPEQVETALRLHRLPVTWAGVSWEDLQPWLGRDKKAREDGLTFVLTGGFGDVRVRERIPMAEVRRAADSILA